MTAPPEDRDDDTLVGYAFAGLVPVAVGAFLTIFRDDIGNANLALVMVLVVVLAGLVGGRGAALPAAVVATLSYDFFLTKPYLSLSIDSADDVETTLVLLAIGLVVGQISVVARRRRSAAERGSDEITRLHRVAEGVVEGASVEAVIDTVCREITGLLRLQSCRFDRTTSQWPLPRLEHNGAMSGVRERHFARDAAALPEEGIELVVRARGEDVGWLLLEPEPGARRGVSLEERIVAVALADQLGAAIAASST